MGNEASSPVPSPPSSSSNNNPLENQAILKSIEQVGENQYSAKIKCVLLGAMGGMSSFHHHYY